ncbi:hypothetical protein HAX54_011009 [Datura stramonium]|uniref:Uncharacterized protein n=1 Tax=Datura stramonium TaxID=4076 RepID=A0ABS8WYA4_DATST|nr:hypothetical protein [Datura stramonium]
MVAFPGEGAARYYDKKEERKCFHQGDNITWASTMLNNSEPYDYIDNNDSEELELNYFTSILFGYLPLRNGNSVIIEPYSPCRFNRQFGFYQRIPDDYKTWWSKTHENFLDSYLQTLVDAIGLVSTNISKVAPQGCSNATPKTGNSSASMGESTSSHEDRCWKKVRSSNKSGDSDLVVLEIPDSVDRPSRTLSVPFKESVIWGKLSGSDVDCASSLKEVILEDMYGKDVDVSPMMRLMKSFFDLAAIYDQARSTLHHKDMEAATKELSIEARERL